MIYDTYYTKNNKHGHAEIPNLSSSVHFDQIEHEKIISIYPMLYVLFCLLHRH